MKTRRSKCNWSGACRGAASADLRVPAFNLCRAKACDIAKILLSYIAILFARALDIVKLDCSNQARHHVCWSVRGHKERYWWFWQQWKLLQIAKFAAGISPSESARWDTIFEDECDLKGRIEAPKDREQESIWKREIGSREEAEIDKPQVILTGTLIMKLKQKK